MPKGLSDPARDRNHDCQEKPRREYMVRPYRKPTQVGEARSLRRSSELVVKELGKMPRNFGRRGAALGEATCSAEPKRAAENRPKRLFSKNTGVCKVVRRRIGTDACPVPEG